MGIQSSSAVLKAYFETGDVPTSAQFGEFIDSTAYYDYSLEKLFLSGSGTGSFGQINAKELHPYTGSSTINVSASLIPPYTTAGSGSNLGSQIFPWISTFSLNSNIDHLSKFSGSGAITVSGGLNPSVTSGVGVGFDLGSPIAKWKQLHVSGINANYISSSIEPDQTNLRNLGSSTKQFSTIFAKSASLEYISASNGTLGTTIQIAKINQVSGALLPFADNVFDLGSSAKSFKDLHVQGTATIGTLSFANISTGNVSASGYIHAMGDITASGILKGEGLVITDDALITDNLIVNGDIDLDGALDVNGTTNLDIVDIDGAVDMATSLTVAGNVDFNGDLDVDGTTNLDAVDIDGAVNMATTLILTGNADFNGDLDVDGTTNLDVVDIDGAVDMALTLTLAGNADFNGDLDVDGTTNLDTTNIVGTATITTLSANTASIGRVGSELTPTTNDAYSIGRTNFKFKDIHVVSSSIDYVSSSLNPHKTSTYDLGSPTLKWRSASINHITASTIIVDNLIAKITTFTATNTITGSNQFGSGSSDTNSFSGSISAVTNITASGNISSSGTITAASFIFGNSSILTNQLTSSTSVWVSGSGQNVYINNNGTISASSTISSSGTIIAEHFFSSDDAVITDNLIVGSLNSSGIISSSTGLYTIGGFVSASDASGSVQIISGGIFHNRVEGASDDSENYTVHGRRFTVKNQLQTILPASQSSTIFTVNNASVQDGDVVIGTFMGLTGGGVGTLSLSASIHCFTTSSLSRGFAFYIHNNKTTPIADDSDFTASFVVL